MSIIARLYVSWDGYLYLASAKALFTSDFDLNYHWFREPFYPILLRLSNSLFGDSDIGFIFLNVFVLSLSISYLLTLLQINRIRTYLVFILIFGNSLTIGFAGSILQQTIIGANLIMVFTIAVLVYKNDRDELKIRDEFFILFSVFAISLTTVVVYPIFILVIFFIIILKWHMRKKIINLRFLIFSLALFIIIATSWQLYKNKNSRLTFNFAEPSYQSYLDQNSQFFKNDISKLKIFTGLLSLTSDTDDGKNGTSGKSEVDTFGFGKSEFALQEICGYFNEGQESAVEYVYGFVDNSCKPKVIHKFIVFNNPISKLVYQLSIFILLFGSIILSRKSKFILLLCFMSWSFLGVYFFFGMGISRFIFPLYFLSVIFVFSFKEICNLTRKEQFYI